MLRKLPVVLVPLVLSCPAVSFGESSGPTNYDECIVDTMRGVSSDVAAQAIIDSCARLFPQPQVVAAPPAASAEPAAAVVPVAPAAAAAVAAPATVPATPLDTSAARSLTADELDRLSTVARVFGSTYKITIENGNPDLTLTEVTIAVWDDGDAVASRKEYSEAAQIAPQTSAMVQYTVHYRGDESSWNWSVVGAQGVE